MPAEAERTDGDEKRKVCHMGMLARGEMEEELVQKTEKGTEGVSTACPCECVLTCVYTCV